MTAYSVLANSLNLLKRCRSPSAERPVGGGFQRAFCISCFSSRFIRLRRGS